MKVFTNTSQCQSVGHVPRCQVPSPPKLGIGYLATSLLTIGVETALARCTLKTSSLPPRKLGSGKLICKLHIVQFQLKSTQFNFVYTFSCTLGSVYLNMNSGILETESVKFSPFSGVLYILVKLVCVNCINSNYY